MTLQYHEEDFAQRRVLVVEDEHETRMLLAELLEQRGYRVTTMQDGLEALVHLRNEPPPDLVLLDLQMPMMDGYELREWMAADRRLAQVPVVLLTSARSVDRRRLGEVAVLPKPLRMHQLLTILAHHA